MQKRKEAVKGTRKQEIEKILENAGGHPVDVCRKLYGIMKESQQPEELLQQILEYPDLVGDPDDENPETVMQEEIDDFLRLNYSYIIQFTRLLAGKNLTQEEFYLRLYKEMFESASGLLPESENAKSMILETLANRVRCVPYYQLYEAEDVSEEVFEAAVEKIEPQLKKARHILQRDFKTKTKLGIQYYKMLNDISDETEKVVFLSLLLGLVRTEAMRDDRRAD